MRLENQLVLIPHCCSKITTCELTRLKDKSRVHVLLLEIPHQWCRRVLLIVFKHLIAYAGPCFLLRFKGKQAFRLM